jgi:signal transduction histidine kinase
MNMLARTINIPANHLKQEDWISLKKTNLLMAARSRLVEYAIRGGIFLALIYQSNIYQATVWLVISICIDLLIAKETKRYNQHATDESTIAVNAPMVVRYQYYWYLNALWFGLTSLIFSAKQDVESQMVMISLLNFITLVGATRNIADGKFCQNILFVFAFSQIVGIVWNIVVVFNFSAPNLHFIYIVFLFFQYSVMMKNSKFFFKQMDANFKHQYRNIHLINDLQTESELREQQRKIAISANETIQRFYSNAAHDVRQPVYAMQMYASMLQETPELGPVLLPKIQQSCQGIEALFNSLFDFQQMKLGSIAYQPKKVNINILFQELNTQFTPLAEKKGLTCKFKPIKGDIYIDAILIKRVLSNLIANAIRYTNTGGILIGARHQVKQKSLTFEIWDTGLGIADENKLNIFSEFFKVTDKTFDTNEGFGLGLSIVKQLSHLVQDSEIKVQSKLNKGSVFKFSVPDALYSASWTLAKAA